MAGDRIVAVGLLTSADVALLGQGFRRLFPVPHDGDFSGLLAALDRIELSEEVRMDEPQAADQASEVSAADGQVLVDGPAGVAITFTVRAARETAERLLRASEAAEMQPSAE